MLTLEDKGLDQVLSAWVPLTQKVDLLVMDKYGRSQLNLLVLADPSFKMYALKRVSDLRLYKNLKYSLQQS